MSFVMTAIDRDSEKTLHKLAVRLVLPAPTGPPRPTLKASPISKLPYDLNTFP